jgi:hypothetical protein
MDSEHVHRAKLTAQVKEHEKGDEEGTEEEDKPHKLIIIPNPY